MSSMPGPLVFVHAQHPELRELEAIYHDAGRALSADARGSACMKHGVQGL